MNLKVKHKELSNVSNFTKTFSNELDTEIDVWLTQLALLQNVWQGEDATLFVAKAKSYFERMKIISSCYRTLSSFMDEANNVYEENDRGFGSNLKEEASNYE